MIDNADKDKKCTKYDRNFSIRVYMTKIDKFEFKKKTLKLDKHKPSNRKWENQGDSDGENEPFFVEDEDIDT